MREQTAVAEAATTRVSKFVLLAVGLLLGAGLFLAGCSVCSPGEETNCVCEDGSSGTKVCSEEYAWNSCQCDGSAGDKGNHSGTLKFSMVDAGTEHACGILKSSGEVRCWGANDKGQSDAPPGEFADVAAGPGYSCAISEGGGFVCWGEYDFGTSSADGPKLKGTPDKGYEDPMPYEGGPYRDVEAGRHTVCVTNTSDDTVCYRESSQEWWAPAPYSWDINKVSVGGSYMCYDADYSDNVSCFRATDKNSAGSFGNGTRLLDFDAGGGHLCGILKETQQITCVSEPGKAYAAKIPDRYVDQAYVDVSAGGDVTCGVELSSYDPYCWGKASSDVTDPPNWKFDNISVGLEFACGLTTTDEVVCWGANDVGQADPPSQGGGSMMSDAGDVVDSGTDGGMEGPPVGCDVPRQPLAAGGNRTCALTDQGEMKCWGAPLDTGYKRGGDFGGQFVSVSTQTGSRGGTTCGIRPDGTHECGGEAYWQRWKRVNVREEGWADISGQLSLIDVTHWVACGLRLDGSMRCWGQNGPPRPHSGTYRDLSVNFWVSCGIETDGSLECWSKEPGRWYDSAPPAGSYESVGVTTDFACALDEGGSVDCWGRADRVTKGQLSAPSGSFQALAVGSNHACAIETNGQITCWGENYDESGQSTRDGVSIPSGSFDAIAAGKSHTCARRLDGTLKCWGLGSDPNTEEGSDDHDQASPPAGSFRPTDATYGCNGGSPADTGVSPSDTSGGERDTSVADTGQQSDTSGSKDTGGDGTDSGQKMCTTWCADPGYVIQCDSVAKKNGKVRGNGGLQSKSNCIAL